MASDADARCVGVFDLGSNAFSSSGAAIVDAVMEACAVAQLQVPDLTLLRDGVLADYAERLRCGDRPVVSRATSAAASPANPAPRTVRQVCGKPSTSRLSSLSRAAR